MKLKFKVFIVTILSMVILAVITTSIFYSSYFGYIQQREEENTNKKFEVMEYILGSQEDDLYRILVDWAKWDDTYEFMNDLNKDYISSNLNESVFINLNLKSIYFLDDKGDVIHKKSYKIDEDASERIIKRALIENKGINITDDANTGLIMDGDKLYMISRSAITLSNDKSKRNGSLIFVKEVDAKLLSYIEQVSGIILKFEDIETIKDKNEVNIAGAITSHDSKIQPYIEKGYLEYNKVIKDIRGENSIVANVLIKQDNGTVYFFRIFMLGFILIVAIVVGIDLVFADKYILKRLAKLNKFIEDIANSKDTTLRIEMSGKDEIYKLSEATNEMLSEIHSADEEIKKMGERFKNIIEATNDGYLDMNVKTKEMYISLEWKNIIGYKGSDEHELYISYFSKIHPQCRKRLKREFLSILNGEVEYFSVEYRIVKDVDNIIWVEQRGKVVEKDESGKSLRIASTVSDITDRKHYEEEILFLSYSDQLTDLKNRTFMEKEFKRLDNNKESNYYIIMIDINGLKLSNDYLGYKDGDKILVIVSLIFREVCPANSIVSRWGGGEFVILVTNKDEDYMAVLIDNIIESCEKENLTISISLGYAKLDEVTKNSAGVMNLAERRMYRNKLLNKKSARSAIITSLERTLYEKHSETQEHTMRIKSLSFKLGKKLGLPMDKLDELKLLSVLHDIGKIGIPEQILMKPGKLTEEEWIIMKTHSEIGYRITNSTPELAHISVEILAHHERYDGAGYPNGLKGEEIPFLSRIINIVDSYDVMTHRRVYKESFEKGYVIKELKRCAGGQFDPVLVEEFIKLLEEESLMKRKKEVEF